MYFLNQQSIKSFLESPNMVRGVLYLCATFSAGETFLSNPRWFTSSSWLTVPFVLFFTSQDKLEAKLDDLCKQNMKDTWFSQHSVDDASNNDCPYCDR